MSGREDRIRAARNRAVRGTNCNTRAPDLPPRKRLRKKSVESFNTDQEADIGRRHELKRATTMGGTYKAKPITLPHVSIQDEVE